MRGLDFVFGRREGEGGYREVGLGVLCGVGRKGVVEEEVEGHNMWSKQWTGGACSTLVNNAATTTRTSVLGYIALHTQQTY